MGFVAWRQAVSEVVVASHRVDRKGHSSSKLLTRDKELIALPTPFVPIPVEVMRSSAYMTLGIHGRRLLDFLLIEQIAHGHQLNGRLVATYDQLAEAGIPRRKIRGAIADLEKRGLVRRTAIGCGNRRTGDRQPSRYRLTFFGSLPDRMEPTNEWRLFTAPKRRPKAPKNTSAGVTIDNLGCHTVVLRRALHGT
jgi:hypothetical protein